MESSKSLQRDWHCGIVDNTALCNASIPSAPLPVQLLANAPGEAVKDVLRACAPATHEGDPDETPGWTSPAWGSELADGRFSLCLTHCHSLSLCLPNK